jgi:hypothetical protein
LPKALFFTSEGKMEKFTFLMGFAVAAEIRRRAKMKGKSISAFIRFMIIDRLNHHPEV